MFIKFWGTRGSLPQCLDRSSLQQTMIETLQALPQTSKEDLIAALKRSAPQFFGGNSTCLEIQYPKQPPATQYFIDAGSGLFAARKAHPVQHKIDEVHIFQTHFHWDHIIGLNLFDLIYQPGKRVHFHHIHKNAEDCLSVLFRFQNFPVKWEIVSSQIRFHQHQLYKPFKVDGIEATAFALDHPGGSFGYKFKHGGKTFSYGIDSEYKRRDKKSLKKDSGLFENTDLFIFDAQFEPEELIQKYDWGHGAPHIGVELGYQFEIPHLVFSHHDPYKGDQKIQEMTDDARHFAEKLKSGRFSPKMIAAYDGLSINMLDLKKTFC